MVHATIVELVRMNGAYRSPETRLLVYLGLGVVSDTEAVLAHNGWEAVPDDDDDDLVWYFAPNGSKWDWLGTTTSTDVVLSRELLGMADRP